MNPETGNETQAAPKVIFWFRLYAAFMAAIYALCVLAGPVLIYISSRIGTHDQEELLVQAVILMVVGLPFSIACALPFFLPRKPWVWVYDLVVICIGLTSCCCLPASIPLLIYWIKPEIKEWFGKG